MNQLYVNQLKELVSKYGRRAHIYIKSNTYKYLVKALDDEFPQLKEYPLGVKVWWAIAGLTDFPKCKTCGKLLTKVKVSPEFGYASVYCSSKCAARDPEVQAKKEKTSLEKYGTKNAGQSDKAKEKRKKTNLEKYGVENVYQAKEVKDKIKTTLIERYSVDSPLKSDEIKDKVKKTNLEKYGVENVYQAESIKEKIKAVNIEKYGAKTYMESNVRILKDRTKEYNEFLNSDWIQPLFTLDEFTNICNVKTENYKLKFLCKKCNHEFESKIDYLFFSRYGLSNIRCPHCFPQSAKASLKERALGEFIKSVYSGEIVFNSKSIISPYELDIYIPEKKLAIEFDGLYWHSDSRKDKNYHLFKTNLCVEKGIQLIHIFEDEWDMSEDIVKDRIATMLGIYSHTVYARQCEVREVKTKNANQFLADNHIQGIAQSSIKLGLYYKDELVSLMTFGKSRFNKDYEYELIRFCNKASWHIPGGAGKLLSYFENTYKPRSLLSYCDLRWSTGKLYEALGFTKLRISPPNYWYVREDIGIRESRQKYQKHKLAGLLAKFDPTKSESENMEINGYGKVYDCGNLVFVKEFK